MNIERLSLEDIIGKLARRLDRLETGGKPLVDLSARAFVSVPLTAGTEVTLAATLAWNDLTVQSNPNGIPYFVLYVDNDETAAYRWPAGTSLSAGQNNLTFDWFMDDLDLESNNNRSRVYIRIKNNDSGSHTYYLHLRWVYIGASSGSS